MGFAGGMVPSPSALVVLLGAVALRRVWFGLILVVAYGLGMAATLTTAGLLLDRARRLLERNGRHRSGGPLVTLGRWLPTVTATIIVIVGLGLAVRGAAKI
jgi:ABC-type nickel/cobalt efflux system permease component RcnA